MNVAGRPIPLGVITSAVVAFLAMALSGCDGQVQTQSAVVGVAPISAAAATPEAPPTRPATRTAATAPPPTAAPQGTPRVTPTPIGYSVPDSIVRALNNSYADVDWFQGQLSVTINNGSGNSNPLILRQWYKRPNQMRLEVVKPGTTRLTVGTVVVFDGKTLILYDPAADRVVQIQDPAETVLLMNFPHLEISPALQLFRMGQFISSFSSQSTVNVRGLNSVAGRTARFVELNPKTASPFQSVRLWLDQRTSAPLRIDALAANGGVTTIEYLQFDPATEVGDDAFSFTPPTNTPVTHPSLEELAGATGFQPATLAEAQDKADYPVLQPDSLPPGTTQRSLRTSGSNGPAAVAFFYGTTQAVSTALVERPAVGRLPLLLGSKPINQGGFTGQIYETQQVVVLDWTRGNTALTMVSTLPRDEAIKIAGSVK